VTREIPLRRIAIALAAGIAAGLFLGDEAAVFGVVADGFVKLLQMAVLPYVTVSIIGSIGSLDAGELRRLGTRAALVLPLLWGIALAFALLMPLTFPPSQNASFFSTSMLESPPPFDIVSLYIPANPFFAMANSIVPGVVLFSLTVGIALIGVRRKRVLLAALRTASLALARVMGFVVTLTPYGIFAIAATTAGTLRIEQAARLELYLLAYAGLALVLALWALPGLVSALTGIPVREIFASTRGALLTAAVAGDLFIVLPVLIGACRELSARYLPENRHAEALPDVIVPVSYNFPHSGKLLSVSFILFAGWFSDASVHPADYPRLAGASLLSLFGSVNTAVPFLLDLFRIPADTFQLFVASSVLNSRFGTLVAAMHTVAVALLGTWAVSGVLRWQQRALIRYAVVTSALVITAVGGTRVVAAVIFGSPVPAADRLASMTLDVRSDAAVLAATSVEQPPPDGERLETITSRGTLRVGYLSDSLPYAFLNGYRDLVGLDVALMHRLANELNVSLEFVPLERRRLDDPHGVAELLDAGSCDVVIGGVAVTTRRAGFMQLSTPYLDETLGFVVRDDERRLFSSWESIREAGALSIAVPDVPYFVERVHERAPAARLHRVRSTEDLFALPDGSVDALAIPAERGSAWTLRFPQYSAVVPQPDPVKVPLAFALPAAEPGLAAFINTWIDLNRRGGTLDALYRYWILGRDPARGAPRWSIIRDVLHWVE
jgi:Na+/H+-dicarboxylate symporter/ABC-type amino acid transport substrate-binding protein